MTGFYHSLGLDCFILSMPLKGVNIGPGSNASYVEDEHWWFLQWEQRGDYALRYFVEPAYLTANYAFAQGYEQLHMAGLSGGGWTTTVAAAIDKRITASFPIAGSVPCAMRDPNAGPDPCEAGGMSVKQGEAPPLRACGRWGQMGVGASTGV